MKILFFVAAIVVAFYIGQKTATQTIPPTPTDAQTDLAKPKLQSILDSEYEEYQRLKTSEEKFKKADEILGKIMVIFLADLQLKISKSPAQTASAPVASATSTPLIATSPANQAAAASATRPLSQNAHVFLARQLNDQEQVTHFIQAKRKEDLRADWVGASVLKQYPATLEGCYIGMATQDSDGEVWQMTMFHHATGAKEGLSMIVAKSPLGGMSRNRGRGNPNGYRSDRNDPGVVLIETGDQILYQLYYVPALSEWVGNYYKKQADESRKPIGKVVLSRGTGCEE